MILTSAERTVDLESSNVCNFWQECILTGKKIVEKMGTTLTRSTMMVRWEGRGLVLGKKYQQISHIGHCALKTLIRIKWQHKPLQDLKIILFISPCIKNGEDMNAKNDLYSYVHCTTNVNYSLRSKFGK